MEMDIEKAVPEVSKVFIEAHSLKKKPPKRPVSVKYGFVRFPCF